MYFCRAIGTSFTLAYVAIDIYINYARILKLLLSSITILLSNFNSYNINVKVTRNIDKYHRKSDNFSTFSIN